MTPGFDWRAVFEPGTPILEMVVRGTIVYLTLFVLLRVVLKRQSAGFGVTDLLVIVLIADAAQNAMSANYQSLPDGLVLVATIVFWAFALDWLSFHVRWVRRLTTPAVLPLVKDGRLLRENLRNELIMEDEVRSQLRLHGVDDLAEVKRATMESDGGISVVRADGGETRPHARKLA